MANPNPFLITGRPPWLSSGNRPQGGGQRPPFGPPRPPRPPPPMPLPPGPPPLPLTPYARKYGVVDYDALPFLAGTSSSGMAPRSVFPKSRMEYFLEMALDASQREQLGGFTTQELVDLGAHGRQGLKPSNLQGPLHPVLNRSTQWVSTLRPYDIGNGWGIWDASNDYLWGVLEPCFQLATRFLESSFLHSWFTALFFGDLRPIADHRFGSGRNTGWPRAYVSFHNVEHVVASEVVRAKWVEMARFVQFAFGIQLRSDLVRARTKHRISQNCNYLPPIRGVIPERASRIEINISALAPLLYPSISVADRLICQFTIAKTIVHELCHAVGIYAKPDIPLNPVNHGIRERTGEMFFYEDEIYVELGFSFENAVFGGTAQILRAQENYGHDRKRLDLSFPPIAANRGDWPHFGAVFARKKDDESGEGYTSEVQLPSLNVGQFTPRTFSALYIPIHLTWLEDIQQEDYWLNCVPKWGADMCKPFPRIFGLRGFVDPSNPQGGMIRRHFGGKRSVEATKTQFPGDRADPQLRALSIRRFNIVKELCNTLRLRRDEKMSINSLYGPVGFWDPDSEAGDTILEVDDEDQMRDAIAEALGYPRAQLDPQFSTEFFIKYFFLTPIVPKEKGEELGAAILNLNENGLGPNRQSFNANQFLQLPEAVVESALRNLLTSWGYPPNYPWQRLGESFRGVRRARRMFQEELDRSQGVGGMRRKRGGDDDEPDDELIGRAKRVRKVLRKIRQN